MWATPSTFGRLGLSCARMEDARNDAVRTPAISLMSPAPRLISHHNPPGCKNFRRLRSSDRTTKEPFHAYTIVAGDAAGGTRCHLLAPFRSRCGGGSHRRTGRVVARRPGRSGDHRL